MKILITGSKGLIGTALKRTLLSLGIDVIGFDHKYSQDHPEFGEILDQDALYQALQDVDGIVHLAAVSRVIFGEKNPKLCWETNVIGTQNVLEGAKKATKKPWVLYASSREVYGQQQELPVRESAPLIPVNIYGESKIAAETMIVEAQQEGHRAAIVRFSNVYGSVLDHHDRVVPAFCRAAAFGSDIIVEGKDNLFDFTYIEDVIQGILPILYMLQQGRTPTPIHLTTGQSVSLGDIAQIAQEISSHAINIKEGASRSFDVATFCGDTQRAKKVLGWQACVTIQQGMQRLINQYMFSAYSASQPELMLHH